MWSKSIYFIYFRINVQLRHEPLIMRLGFLWSALSFHAAKKDIFGKKRTSLNQDPKNSGKSRWKFHLERVPFSFRTEFQKISMGRFWVMRVPFHLWSMNRKFPEISCKWKASRVTLGGGLLALKRSWGDPGGRANIFPYKHLDKFHLAKHGQDDTYGACTNSMSCQNKPKNKWRGI